MLSPLPPRSDWRHCFAPPASHISLPREGGRVGLRIGIFEVCSAFTHVTACTLALSPIRDLAITHFSVTKPGNLAYVMTSARERWRENGRRTSELGSRRRSRQANFGMPDYANALAWYWSGCGRASVRRFPWHVRIGPRPRPLTDSCLTIVSTSRTS